MASKVSITPAEGRVLRDHTDNYRQIPAGTVKSVRMDKVWIRRIKDGDAIKVDEKKSIKTPHKVEAERPKPKNDTLSLPLSGGEKAKETK